MVAKTAKALDFPGKEEDQGLFCVFAGILMRSSVLLPVFFGDVGERAAKK